MNKFTEVKVLSNQELRQLAELHAGEISAALYYYFAEDAFMNKDCRRIASCMLKAVECTWLAVGNLKETRSWIGSIEKLDREMEYLGSYFNQYGFPLSARFIARCRAFATKLLKVLDDFEERMSA